jgi:hypothetical protein
VAQYVVYVRSLMRHDAQPGKLWLCTTEAAKSAITLLQSNPQEQFSVNFTPGSYSLV